MSDDYFEDHFENKPEPFQGSAREDNHANIKEHAAWYNEDNLETVSAMKVRTRCFPLGAWDSNAHFPPISGAY